MMIIRDYDENTDLLAVARLIAETFREFNLSFAPREEVDLFLGPFRHAVSPDPAQQAEIARVVRAALVLVAEDEGQIVGVLRGRPGRLQSLFVRGAAHRRGVGRLLMERFEQACIERGASQITMAATLYAVPFYQRLGYKRSTGVRVGHSFEGRGLPIQPMKKVLG